MLSEFHEFPYFNFASDLFLLVLLKQALSMWEQNATPALVVLPPIPCSSSPGSYPLHNPGKKVFLLIAVPIQFPKRD